MNRRELLIGAASLAACKATPPTGSDDPAPEPSPGREPSPDVAVPGGTVDLSAEGAAEALIADRPDLIIHLGGNGDYYIGSDGVDLGILRPPLLARFCTSGQRYDAVTAAVACLYRIGQAEREEALATARSLVRILESERCRLPDSLAAIRSIIRYRLSKALRRVRLTPSAAAERSTSPAL